MYVKLPANKSVCMHENIVCIPICLNQTSTLCLFRSHLFCTTERCAGKTEFTQLNVYSFKEKSSLIFCQHIKL